ncbi:MAG: signal peptidase I [Bacilli bacterium]
MFKKIINNKIFQGVYKIIKTLFVLSVVLYLCFVIFQRISNNGSIMGYRIFNIATASMDPIYKVDDVILINEIDCKNLKIGDDITYLGIKDDMKDKIITHRIINIEEKPGNTYYFHTKGVANTTDDPTVEESQIYGKVVSKLTIISFINQIVRNKFGFFFLVFAPLVLVVFLEIADTVVELKDKKKENEEEDENTNS